MPGANHVGIRVADCKFGGEFFSSSSGKKSSWIKRITKETENMVSWAGLHKNYGVYGVDHLTPII